MIPVMRPQLPEPSAFNVRLEQIHSTGIYSNYGPQVQELEARFASRLGVSSDQVIVMSSATAALTGIVSILGFEIWRIPSWTFVATALSVANSGKRLQFADVDAQSHTMKCRRDRPDMGNIITLPFGVGLPEDWTNPDSYPEVIDGAASLGAIQNLGALPEHSNIVFSLHATKYLGSGEGGILVSGDPRTVKKLRAWSNFGFSGSRESQLIGNNAKMSEFQAAIAHTVLDNEAGERKEWTKLRDQTLKLESRLSIEPSKISKGTIAPYWIANFESAEQTETVETGLKRVGIESRRWWAEGCHKMPALRGREREDDLPNTGFLASHTLGLPYFRGLTEVQLDRVETALKKFL